MKKIYTLVGCALLSGVAVAQSPFQVNGQYKFNATSKHAPNGITFIDMRDAVNHYQDRVVFYEEDFDAGFNGWVAATQSGPVDFEISNVGHANDAGSTFTIPALLSSTPANWVLFDSDSDGTSNDVEQATLTSPTIDLTALGVGAGPYQLKLEFEQFFAEWEQDGSYDTLYIGVSDDNGITWDETAICDGVGREGRPNPEIISWNISPYIVDATQVKIRFRWEGSWAYGWQFDNVNIAELPDNDMTVLATFRGDLANSLMYSQMPLSQAIPFVIGADVKNIGFNNQTNIALEWEIFNPSGTSVGSGTSASTIPMLANNQNDTIWINTGVTPTALGNYTIEFNVIAAVADDAASNNTKEDEYFWLTDYTYAADFGPSTGAIYNFAANNDGAFSIGNRFLINANDVIGGVTAELDNNVIVEDKLMFFLLYKLNTDAVPPTFEYLEATDDYTTTSTDNGQFVTIFFDAPINVTAGEEYLAMGAHYGGTETVGFEMAGALLQGHVLGTNESNALSELISPSAPVVRLLMNDFTGVEETTAAERFEVYPNPATEALTVTLTLTQSENTVINVLDITGKVVKTINVGNVNGDKNITVSLDEMTSGIYFIQLVNADGKQVKKFVKK